MMASVKVTIVLMVLIATTVLIGAWCPQEAQVGQEKIIEQFGEEKALMLIQLGITDIFHTPFFLLLIAGLTANMVACSFQRVFPKIKLLRQPMPYLSRTEIGKMPYSKSIELIESIDWKGRHGNAAGMIDASTDCRLQVLTVLAGRLRKKHYRVEVKGDRLIAESGKFSKAAATVTHIGLLSLLLGVTVTSWTGFSGFQPVKLGSYLTFGMSEHSKLWIGHLPAWKVKVEGTRREDYESGEAKQWYSDLAVMDDQGKVLHKQQISVNNPLSYEGVDIYQSSWGLEELVLQFNGTVRKLPLRPMGKLYAAFLPLEADSILIFSVKNQTAPLRIFAKRPDWESPRLLAEVPPSATTNLGPVKVKFDSVIPVTGLQYKCDPGLPITYVAFGIIITGVLLATFPHRHVWAHLGTITGARHHERASATLTIGGRSNKAKVGYQRQMNKLIESLEIELRQVAPDDTGQSDRSDCGDRSAPGGPVGIDRCQPDESISSLAAESEALEADEAESRKRELERLNV